MRITAEVVPLPEISRSIIPIIEIIPGNPGSPSEISRAPDLSRFHVNGDIPAPPPPPPNRYLASYEQALNIFLSQGEIGCTVVFALNQVYQPH